MNEKAPAQGLLVFLGVCTLDTIARVAAFPEPESRSVAEDFAVAGGGPAATAAVAAARAGAHTAFIGTVGDDPEGERILAGLRSEGVDTSAVTREPGRSSGASIILVGPQGTRAIVTRPVPDLAVDPSTALPLLAGASWVHADHLGWAALGALPHPGHGYRTSVDGGNPIPGFDPAGVDLYAPTLSQLAGGTPPQDPAEIASLLQRERRRGAVEVVATDGANGCWAMSREGRLPHVPAAGHHAYSTLGAGDVFHGALLAGVSAGLGLFDSVQYASETAALSCAGLDGRSRIPHRHPTAENRQR